MDANNQTWEASAPVDDAATRLAAADNEPAVHTPPSPTPTPPLLSPSSSGSHEASTSTTTPLIDSTTYYPTADPTAVDHLNATVETMWEARRAREEAERIAEQKLIDAVCAASLLEYNEKNRALETYESELAAKASERDQELERLRLRREAAEQKKRDAMQKVIDAKTRAAQLSAKVKDATKEYEAKTAERVAKELEREELAKQRAQEQSLRELAQRKDDAMRRREEAERKAQEALRKAEEMRRKAIEAAQIVRQKSRLQIEHELNAEEEARQRHAEMTLGTLEREKIAARERKEAAARKAMEAQRRAEELRLRAEQARNAARSKAASYASPQTA